MSAKLYGRISLAILVAATAGCAGPLFISSPVKDPSKGELIVPYFDSVDNTIEVAVVPATAKGGDTPPPTVTITLIPTPKTRAYLYLNKSLLFSDSANISVSTNGMLSSSDSSSVQVISSALTELAQAAAAVGGSPALLAEQEKPDKPTPPAADPKDRGTCIAGLAENPFYKTINAVSWNTNGTIPLGSAAAHSDPNDKSKTVTLDLSLALELPKWAGLTVESLKNLGEPDSRGSKNGFVVFYPVPVTSYLTCSVEGRASIQISLAQALNLYLESDFVVPQRGFFSNPADTYTLSSGFITGHKYTDQSPVKTVVDTITAPVRAIMPSMSVTNTTQVQTGGGKPDQTTQTTQTTTSPPK